MAGLCDVPALRGRTILLVAWDSMWDLEIKLPGVVTVYPDDGSTIRRSDGVCDPATANRIADRVMTLAGTPAQPFRHAPRGSSSVIHEYAKWLIMMERVVPPLVFVSYSHNNRKEVEMLNRFLKGLQNNGKIQLWSDHRLRGGDEWTAEIADRIDRAHIVILILTSDYIASDAIAKWEIPHIMTRAAQPRVTIYPIHARMCPVKANYPWLGGIEIRPSDTKPLWPNPPGRVETYLTKIAEEIAELSAEYLWVRDSYSEEQAGRKG